MQGNLSGSLKIRTDLKDRYVLLARLGSGGMADVYLGIQRGAAGFEQLVVIKRIKMGRISKGDESIKLFVREARTVAQLNHPHIVKVFDLCRMNDAVAIVMEYVDGENLEYIARALRKAKRRIPLSILSRLIMQACEGLHYAHTAKSPEGTPLNLVHRDVGPHNLMIDSSGYLKVIDFGIAKTAGQMDLTSPGVIKGKLSYLAPDYFKFADVDKRIDVYAMGLVLYRMLTLKVPFEFSPNVTIAEVIKRVSEGNLPPPSKEFSDLPAELDEIVSLATHRDREKRFQSCEELAERLRACAERHGGLAPAPEARKWYQETFRARTEKRREFEKSVLQKARQMAEAKTSSRTLEEAIESAVAMQEDQSSSLPLGSALANTPSSREIRAFPPPPMAAPSKMAPRRSPLGWILMGLALLAVGGGGFAGVKFFLDRQQRQPEDNLLVLSVPEDGEVFINGTLRGRTGKEGFAARLQPGVQHAIEVRKPGYSPYQVQAVGQESGRLQILARLNELPPAQTAAAPAPEAKPAESTPSQPQMAQADKKPQGTRPGRPYKPGRDRRDQQPQENENEQKPPAQPAPAPVPTPEEPPPAPAPVSEAEPPRPVKNVASVTPPPPPLKIETPPPEKTAPQYLSGNGGWSGEQVMESGCARCHNGGKAPALDLGKKTKSQWEFFFQRNRHDRYAEFEKIFSPGELERVKAFILSRIEKKDKSGIAGER